ncbi:MAG: hypothetical protein QM527_03675 [Alphaproteobacteria bacterium]|nr:hypothetical protein [Alphaproteobacteria bacterium]
MIKKRFWLLVLVLLGVGLVFNHVRWVKFDGRLILEVDGRPVDAVGMVKNQLNALTRDCNEVSNHGAEHPLHQQVWAVVQGYSPPQSMSGQLIGVWAYQGWVLAEAEFAELLPAVVTLKRVEGQWNIVSNAVWSGNVRPWKAAPLIRDYIAMQASGLPGKLRCVALNHSPSTSSLERCP